MLLLIFLALLGFAFLMIVSPNTLARNRWSVLVVTLTMTMLVSSQVAYMTGASDRSIYVAQFVRLDSAPTPWRGDLFDEPLFNAFLWATARVLPTNEFSLYALVGGLMVLLQFLAARCLMPPWGAYLVLLTLLASGLLVAYSSVAIRQGLAISLLVLAAGLFASRRGHFAWLVGLSAAAALLHWTAAFAVVGLACLAVLKPSMKFLLGGWIVLAAGFISGVNERVLSGVTPTVDEYTSSAAFMAYRAEGQRIDFLVFSGLVLCAAVIARRWLPSSVDRLNYSRLLAVYVVFNSIFLIFGFIAYSDRLAAYSWFLIPTLAWYPLIKNDGPRLGQLCLLFVVLAVGWATGSLALLLV